MLSGPAAFEVLSFLIALVISSGVKMGESDSFLAFILRIVLRVCLLDEWGVTEVNILLKLLAMILAELIGLLEKLMEQFGVGLA